VENFIAFLEPGGGLRTMNVAYLHAQYAWLLIFPMQMSADWSYNCVEPLMSFQDPRNLQTLALGLAVVAVVAHAALACMSPSR
jgi:hypothetical protein